VSLVAVVFCWSSGSAVYVLYAVKSGGHHDVCDQQDTNCYVWYVSSVRKRFHRPNKQLKQARNVKLDVNRRRRLFLSHSTFGIIYDVKKKCKWRIFAKRFYPTILVARVRASRKGNAGSSPVRMIYRTCARLMSRHNVRFRWQTEMDFIRISVSIDRVPITREILHVKWSKVEMCFEHKLTMSERSFQTRTRRICITFNDAYS